MFVRSLVHAYFFQRNLVPLMLFLVEMAWVSLWHLSSLITDGTGDNAQLSGQWQVWTSISTPLIERVGSNRTVEGRAAFEELCRRQPACRGEDKGQRGRTAM